MPPTLVVEGSPELKKRGAFVKECTLCGSLLEEAEPYCPECGTDVEM